MRNNGRAIPTNGLESSQTLHAPKNLFRVRPKRFVFFDKGTGTERFEVKASPDGSLPVDQAASLMAIHCFVRGRAPKDFGVMVAAAEDLLDGLLPMAKRLVQACAENRSPVYLSQRQRDVLRALMQDGSNKEIAAKLNISVRTVKFHVSALLEKFNVHSRVSLMRKAADVLLPDNTAADAAPRKEFRMFPANGDVPLNADRAHLQPLRMVAGGQRASR
jgi:DNA-binding CsgD family transcriptional regulator